MIRIKIIFLIFIMLTFSSCLSVSVKNPVAFKYNNTKSISYSISSTAKMNILDKKLSEDVNKINFEKNIQKAIENIEIFTKSSFLQKQKLIPVESLKKEELSDFNGSLYLHLDLSGYGSLKEKWKKWLIGTGFAEGVIQGIVVGSATSNFWLGFGVAAEEFTSEYLTWNGVDWLLGETYAPVTLEGYLYSKSDNKIIWKKSIFVTKNKAQLKKMNKKDKKNKEKQLRASLMKAEKKLFTKLQNYIQKESLYK